MAEQITVAIPAYNEEALIGRTLSSIHKQVFSGDFMLAQENIDPSVVDKLQDLQAQAKELGRTMLNSLRATGKWNRIASTKIYPE